MFLDLGGQSGHRRRLEHRAHRDPRVQGRADAGGDLRGEQRVAAEGEEVVVGADALGPEHLGEHRRDHFLDRRGRRAERGDLELRGRQRLSVQLAVGIERQCFQHHERRGHHVRRQRRRQRRLHHRDIDFRVTGHQVGHQAIAGARVRHRQHGRLRDLRQRQQRGLDLAELDPETTDLHLEIGTAPILQLTGGIPRHQVTGAIHPGTRGERVGDEPIRAQVGAAEVAARQLRTGEIQLTGDAVGHRMQSRVEHVGPRIPFRRTDRHRDTVSLRHPMAGDRHRRLGRTVQVEQLRGVTAPEPLRRRRRQRLTDRQHPAQRITQHAIRFRQQRVQHRRNHMQRGHPRRPHQFVQIAGIAMAVGLRDHQPAAGHGRRPELPDRQVEGRRGLQQHRVLGAEAEFGGLPQQLVDDGRVRHRHALRPARRTGREDHIRGVRRMQGFGAVRIGDRIARHAGHVDPVDLDDRAIRGSGERGRRIRQHTHRVGGLEDVRHALGGLIGIHRHIGTTGGRHRVHRDHQVHRAPDGQGHP
ncbi:hypothetical protein NRB56_76180 [Nocardia sp. RB56]|uniref:Uncharacterized protein n=1 Tax=Nocardia aurantia TaxID=2585199 RepID=A0A7K0E4A4_9NOCA|nr:hypothetical protein [Nocardia aurantia]